MKNLARLSAAVGVAAALVTAGVSASAATPSPARSASSVTVVTPLAAAPTASAGGQVFTAITPCRLANTHFASTRFIELDRVRNFTVRGSGAGFAAQGGTANGCNIPTTATAITTTVNATASTVLGIYNSGYLQGYPTGSAPGTANFLAFKNGGTSGNPTLTLTANGTEPSLSIKSLGGRTEVALDVTGYFAPLVSATVKGVVNGNGTLTPGSSGIVSVVPNGNGSYTVNTANTVAGCTPLVSANQAGQVATARVSGSNAITVNTNNVVGNTPANGPFTLNVLC